MKSVFGAKMIGICRKKIKIKRLPSDYFSFYGGHFSTHQLGSFKRFLSVAREGSLCGNMARGKSHINGLELGYGFDYFFYMREWVCKIELTDKKQDLEFGQKHYYFHQFPTF